MTGTPREHPIVYLYCIAISALLVYVPSSPRTGVCRSDTICANPGQ